MVGFHGNGFAQNVTSRTQQYPNGLILQMLVSGRARQGSSDGRKINRDTGIVPVVILPAGRFLITFFPLNLREIKNCENVRFDSEN